MKFILLFESYQSQKELEQLTKDILYKIGEKTYNRFKDGHVYYFENASLNEIDINKYKVLFDFLTDFKDTNISILTNEDMGGYKFLTNSGVYIVDGDKNRYILIKLDDYTLTKINKKDNILFNDTEEKIKYYVYNDYKYTLIHELQHIYDDWRSKGLALIEPKEFKSNKTLNKQLVSKSLENLKEEELEFVGKHYKDYLNLKFEVDARFTAAINKTSFYDLDFELSIENNKNTYVMLPFSDVLKKFKVNMNQFKFLSDKEQRRMLHKFGKFYELEKDFVKEINEKEKSYK